MFRIVYVSTATAPFSDGALRELLLEARTKNAEAGITGMLVYSRGQFLQALEGEPAVVIGAFDKISADPRHIGVKTLQRGIYSDQWFADWAMGFSSMQKATGHVAVNDRIRLDILDGVTAVDFLRSCSRTQSA